MQFSEIDTMSDREDMYDLTVCTCGGGERPAEECGGCLEYYTWQTAAREVSAMEAPTRFCIANTEVRMLIDRFERTQAKVQQVPIILALIYCLGRYPDLLASAPAIRNALYGRCIAWSKASTELIPDCSECVRFLGTLRSRPDYVMDEQEEEESR